MIGKCLVHARRQFFDIRNAFPDECGRVLDAIGAVYQVEAETEKLSDEERLQVHQEKSGPVLARLRTWIDEHIDLRRIEPNGLLGKACAYLQRHWTHLTQFLRVPGMPLDSNPSERALKQAIVHRKNSLFFKTSVGATVGDILHSLIQTCRLNGVNAWAYLMAVRRAGPEAVRTDPTAWLPWRWAASPG